MTLSGVLRPPLVLDTGRPRRCISAAQKQSAQTMLCGDVRGYIRVVKRMLALCVSLCRPARSSIAATAPASSATSSPPTAHASPSPIPAMTISALMHAASSASRCLVPCLLLLDYVDDLIRYP
jgi:hypothetical protein